jgi:hypothetical protein
LHPRHPWVGLIGELFSLAVEGRGIVLSISQHEDTLTATLAHVWTIGWWSPSSFFFPSIFPFVLHSCRLSLTHGHTYIHTIQTLVERKEMKDLLN